ncbi:MAG: restriction endonuclease subunit S [Methylovulum sp.]|nr:restriction endonuclease subunit S [Methylovulum sp.]
MIQTSTLKGISEFIRTGKTPPTQETKYFNGEIQWFTPGDLDKEKYLGKSMRSLTEASFIDKKAAHFPAGTLLVACIGDIGKLGITTQDCSSNQQITGIKPNSSTDVNYLYYWFRHSKMVIQHFANNAVVPIINNGTLEKIKIPLPPLPEQQKIASILDAADNLRQKDQQLIEKYTALSQSLFLEMFGDPVSNPMGWDKKPLKDVGIVRTGNTPSRENLEYYDAHIEWIKTNNINTPSMYLTPAEEYLSEAGLKVGRCVNAGSILVTCIAGSKSVIGNVAIADRKVAFNQQINSFTPFEGNVLFFYSLFKAGKKHIQSFSTDSMKGMINKSKFESIDFIIPPLELQNQFAERIQSIEAQKQLAIASLEKSEALFNSLLQRAFKGELTV